MRTMSSFCARVNCWTNSVCVCEFSWIREKNEDVWFSVFVLVSPWATNIIRMALIDRLVKITNTEVNSTRSVILQQQRTPIWEYHHLILEERELEWSLYLDLLVGGRQAAGNEREDGYDSVKHLRQLPDGYFHGLRWMFKVSPVWVLFEDVAGVGHHGRIGWR